MRRSSHRSTHRFKRRLVACFSLNRTYFLLLLPCSRLSLTQAQQIETPPTQHSVPACFHLAPHHHRHRTIDFPFLYIAHLPFILSVLVVPNTRASESTGVPRSNEPMATRSNSDGDEHTPSSTRPPSSAGSNPASQSSPWRDIGETSIHGGLSPDLRSVDGEMQALHDALHQLRSAPPQVRKSPAARTPPPPAQIAAEDVDASRPADIAAAAAGGAGAAGVIATKKRGRHSTSGSVSPDALDKKRGRLSGVHDATDQPPAQNEEMEEATKKTTGTTTVTPYCSSSSYSPRAVTASIGRAAPTMMRQRSQEGSVGSPHYSRPPPLTSTAPTRTPTPPPAQALFTGASKTSASANYWRYRQTRDGSAGGSVRASSPQRRTVAPRMSVNRATSPSRREHSVVLDAPEQVANEEEEEGHEDGRTARAPREGEDADDASRPRSSPRWRRSPVRWTPRLSGTLESDVDKLQRLLAAGRSTQPVRAAPTPHRGVETRRPLGARQAVSQPLPGPARAASPTYALAGTPPPRFEEDHAQFHHAARVWRQRSDGPSETPLASRVVGARAGGAGAATGARASVDGMMAYYGRLAVGCRRTPPSSSS